MNAGWIPSFVTVFLNGGVQVFKPIEDIEGRLFGVAEKYVSAVDVGRVLIVSGGGRVIEGLANMLADLEVEYSSSAELSTPENVDLIIIDIDSFGGITTVVDRLQSIRSERPALVTILVSAEFQNDDLSASRLAVCDASVRLPVSFARLEHALIEAGINNDEWLDRQLFNMRDEYRQAVAI